MISIESVSHDIGTSEIFSNLNLCVNKNEKVLILGRSGLGKTSLFRLILGFEQARSGKIQVNGLNLDKTRVHQIRQQLFYLSQDIDLRNEPLIGLVTDIWEFNFAKKLSPKTLDQKLTFLELSPGILDKRTGELSGGERQRIGLLICFLLDRPIWLLDEPTSAVDNAMKKKIATHILSLDKTMVIISHDHCWQDGSAVRIERWH